MLSLSYIAKVLGGNVNGHQVLAPGPGHSRKDRSLSVWINREGVVSVNSFAGDDNKECRRYVYQRLGIQERRADPRIKTVKPRERWPVNIEWKRVGAPAAPEGLSPAVSACLERNADRLSAQGLDGGHSEVVAVYASGRREVLIKTEFATLAYELAERASESREGFLAVRAEGIDQKNAEYVESCRDRVLVDLRREDYSKKYPGDVCAEPNN